MVFVSKAPWLSQRYGASRSIQRTGPLSVENSTRSTVPWVSASHWIVPETVAPSRKPGTETWTSGPALAGVTTARITIATIAARLDSGQRSSLMAAAR